MHRVTFNRSTYDFDRDEVVTNPIASFVVGEDGIEKVDFGEEFVPLEMTVLDPESREVVSLKSDPLRWAELLPSAFRSGDYFVSLDEKEPVEPVESELGSREMVGAEAALMHMARFR